MRKLFSVQKKRFFISLFFVSILTSTFVPVAFAGTGDPWYVAPLNWILDLVLGILGGIHDPMDHVFYNGCGTVSERFQACEARTVWGMYTNTQFETVVKRGYMMFGIFAVFFVLASVTKSGILLSLRGLSSTIKFEVTDAMIKTLIAIILLGHFFPIVDGLFSLNNMLVRYVQNDLVSPGIVTTLDGKSTVPGDGRSINNGRIEMNSLAQGLSEGAVLGSVGDGSTGMGSPVAKGAVSLASRGVAIWWEVFYLQRKIMISLLIILAPLWICCMFYPMLHEITMAGFKELWSQIVAQALHAVLFWGYFHLIDNQMGWFQALVAMCMFIPISESIRFIFGASAQTGGKLATVGTLAGAAGLMNMTKAVSSLGKGAMNAFKESKGIPTGSEGSSGKQFGGASSDGTSGLNGTGRSALERKLRTAGSIGSGVGSAALRMGMTFAGAGLGPLGAHLAGETGGKAGEELGYRGGVASYVAGKAGMGAAKETANRVGSFPSNFSEAYNQMGPRDGDWSAKTAKAAVVATRGGSGQIDSQNKVMSPEESATSASQSRERSAERWGAAGEMTLGRGGYSAGDSYGRARNAGRMLSQEGLTSLRDDQGISNVYAVETVDSSMLATRDDSTGEFKPISNFGKGNPSLNRGETVVSAYQIQGEGKTARLNPVKERVQMPVEGSSQKEFEFKNSSYLHNETGKTAYSGKPVDPNQFIGPVRQESHTDLRRKNFVSKV